KSGRSAYENVQKLEVLKYSRSECADGNPVGRRGARKVFGIDPMLVRDWETQEGELVAFSKKQSAGKQRSLHPGRESDTQKAEAAVVDEINTLRKNGAAVTRDLVMAKLLAEMPTFAGGAPSADDPEKMENIRRLYNAWYYRFLKRHRFSIRRKTSVGQKKPEGWEGKAWAFIQKLRSRKIFELLYNMDQTPIQAEMPSETTVEKTGAKHVRISTGGEAEKLRYTVVLTVRGDGQKVLPRIIYKGTPFRTSFGYPPAGISLGVQKSSWCDGTQSDDWVTQDFMRRPGSSPRDQRPSVLVLDDFSCHREEKFQQKLQSKAKTQVVMLGGGLTPVCQPLDRNINKEFKRGFRAKYTIWIRDNFGRSGKKVSAPSRGLVATWVKEVWAGISAQTILSCFKVCGLTLNLDGSED
ncbi:unnamed protein product, partial [Pylaiella littoralis]